MIYPSVIPLSAQSTCDTVLLSDGGESRELRGVQINCQFRGETAGVLKTWFNDNCFDSQEISVFSG